MAHDSGSEMVDVIEVHYELVNVQRQKYNCKCGGCIETALGPERATPGSRYSLDFAIKVVDDKYQDHIPLARQQRILRRHVHHASRPSRPRLRAAEARSRLAATSATVRSPRVSTTLFCADT